ncbi:MAG: hypothetical protein J6S63_07815, partial [Atopobiaceae bacterium]|nr:hypothetical protein [Atopobiaceae bacterium]
MANDDLPILYAMDAQGQLRHIEEVENGDACVCFCPACGQPMRARNGGKIILNSFAHQPGATCDWAVEAVIAKVAKRAIERMGVLALPELRFHDAVTGRERPMSAARVMRVERVELTSICGRQAPCLEVTVTGGGKSRPFALCVSLRKGLSDAQADELYGRTRGVVLVDLGADMHRRAKALDRHYDRDELIRLYQDEDFLCSVVTDAECGASSWVRNAIRDERERESREEKERRARAEELRRAEREEESRRRAAAERARAEERFARENREGVVHEPARRVTWLRTYDVRRWPDTATPPGSLSPGERLVQNGGLMALIEQKDGRERARIISDLTIDVIDEISCNLESLCQGFDKLDLLFRLGDPEDGRRIALSQVDGRHYELSVGANAREWCCALQGIVSRGVEV